MPRTPSQSVWFNLKAKIACNKQHKLYTHYKKTGDTEVFEKFKTLRRKNKKLVRQLKTHLWLKRCMNFKTRRF